MSYCSACGNALPPRAGVCAYCGQSITAQRSRWRTVMWVAVAAVAGGAAVLAWQIGLFQPTPSTPASPTVTDSPSVPLPTSTSTTSPELADIVEQVVDGVVRIETNACEGGSTGSGFLIGQILSPPSRTLSRMPSSYPSESATPGRSLPAPSWGSTRHARSHSWRPVVPCQDTCSRSLTIHRGSAPM